jgi:DNA polymerase III delta subunit
MTLVTLRGEYRTMPNLYFLFGNDEFAISRRLKEFESDFTDPTSADMNTARLDARSMSEERLNNAVNAMPFLAKRRLVLLANPSSKYNNPSAFAKNSSSSSKGAGYDASGHV